MIPLGAASVAATMAALVACWSGPATRRGGLLVAALSAIGVMVTYPVFFAGTNESFVRGGISVHGAIPARSLGDLALDSYGTWDGRFHRGITSASAVVRLDDKSVVVRRAEMTDLSQVETVARATWRVAYTGIIPDEVQRRLLDSWYSPRV